MFNPANLATEIFGILRSFDYVVNIFDFDGNRVYEPAEARRFFASPKNITVSLHEDGENSLIKMFLSKSTDVNEVSGLIETMRTTATKFGVLFNVRKYERELKPKDLAPNGPSDTHAGVSMNSKGEHEHSPESDQLERITGEVSDLTKNFKEIAGLLKNKKDVKESMDINLTEAEGEFTHLKAFDMDVESDAWAKFQKGYLTYSELPDLDITDEDTERFVSNYSAAHGGITFDHSTAVKATELDRVIKAVEKKTPKLAAVLQKCLNYFVTGNSPRLVDAMVSKALECRAYGDAEGEFDNVPDHDGKTPEKRDMISIKEFRGRVERAAWQDFVNEHIDFSADVDFKSVRLGASANKMAVYLNLVADKTRSPGLANLLTTFATDIEDGRSSPFKVKVAKRAIEIAQHGRVEVGESVIMTESIKAFGQWFDSLSSNMLFESGFGSDDFPWDDRDDNAIDVAVTSVKGEFSVDDFLDSHGGDFNWGDTMLDDEDKVVDYDYLMSSLRHYLQQRLDDALDGSQQASEHDVNNLADELVGEVIEKIATKGFSVETPAADVPAAPEAPLVTESSCECEEGVCECADKTDETELSTEDVVLPSRADDDLASEVVVHDNNTDEMDRIVSLARGNSASWSPRSTR